ncbi:hypothetical protein NMG60_11007043 [Bertholletia excelsa]
MSEKACHSYGPKSTKRKIRIEAQLEQVTQERDQVVKEVKELKGQLDLQCAQQEEELARIRADMEVQNAEIQAKIQAEMQAKILTWIQQNVRNYFILLSNG